MRGGFSFWCFSAIFLVVVALSVLLLNIEQDRVFSSIRNGTYNVEFHLSSNAKHRGAIKPKREILNRDDSGPSKDFFSSPARTFRSRSCTMQFSSSFISLVLPLLLAWNCAEAATVAGKAAPKQPIPGKHVAKVATKFSLPKGSGKLNYSTAENGEISCAKGPRWYVYDVGAKEPDHFKLKNSDLDWIIEKVIPNRPNLAGTYTPTVWVTDKGGTVREMDMVYEVTKDTNGVYSQKVNSLTWHVSLKPFIWTWMCADVVTEMAMRMASIIQKVKSRGSFFRSAVNPMLSLL